MTAIEADLTSTTLGFEIRCCGEGEEKTPPLG